MSSDDLFEDLPADPSEPQSSPAGGERPSLAERMRPRMLDELAGQPELFATGAPLRRAIEADTLGSALVWGPPGSGKTTLARLIQAGTRLPFRTLSAVRSGLPEVRKILDEAETLWTRRGTPIRLFIDEIHRYHKGQQDALLPAVESGAVRLLGATTENPSYGINPALVSRCQVFELAPLAGEALGALLGRALADPERGLGRADLLPADEALDLVARLAEGDARSALNLLEWAVQGLDTGEPLGTEQVSRASRRRPPAYDRNGEGRYQTISALHKSVRGSDPQATLYWLARMVDGGEDPVYIARRLIRMASEDVGLADPQGLVQAIAARDACEHLGLPECALALAQAALYLALAPKSNSLETGWQAAMAVVKSRGALPVPTEFRNAVTAFDRRRGIGAGYRYDHDEKDGYSGQDHLPEALRGHSFWSPVERGFERDLRRRLEWFESRREKPGRSGGAIGDPTSQEPGG